MNHDECKSFFFTVFAVDVFVPPMMYVTAAGMVGLESLT